MPSRDVHLRELVGRQAFHALHLRDHLVATALDAEAVHIISANQRRKILTCLAQVDSLGPDLVSIENNFGLRLVELQVAIGVDEHAARIGLLHELVRQFLKSLRLV